MSTPTTYTGPLTYAGPFPPSGTHEYVITIYALDASTPALSVDSTATAFLESVKDHVLATAALTGTFTKPTS